MRLRSEKSGRRGYLSWSEVGWIVGTIIKSSWANHIPYLITGSKGRMQNWEGGLKSRVRNHHGKKGKTARVKHMVLLDTNQLKERW